MPAKDRDHDIVKRALVKDGWTTIGEQTRINLDKRHVWIDLLAQRNDRSLAVLLEVKGFDSRSSMEDPADALGQYLLYRVFIKANQYELPLYLAVPSHAYNGVLSQRIGQLVINEYDVQLMVFDRHNEEILLWIP
jgi:hypothetical protein